ncbi:hypothetical protein JYU34_000195 [Plutella xylostella]|uniref:Uncharacterized protein n=1 Tax=Plutella xylostella TaxID=51655 RepID=A0ABQ7R766_PLUXY|nr:hypothetical protein JYU34_000192 [Plutella xylostella]KAG7313108.1 hypothetical protein JYU34_000193 [Plutella xylostella]KAG7313110.1 hypothetical protein JYU34_000195 [Plutella xylostella]
MLVVFHTTLAASKVEQQAADISKAWKFDASQINIDPSTWTTEFRERMMKVGVGMAKAVPMRTPAVEWYRTFWLDQGGGTPKLMCGGEEITEVNLTHTDHYVYLGQDDPFN